MRTRPRHSEKTPECGLDVALRRDENLGHHTHAFCRAQATPHSPGIPNARRRTPDDPLIRSLSTTSHVELLRTKPPVAYTPNGSPRPVDGAVRSQGRPLDDAGRARFEPRFGVDFSKVRVHNDPAASALAAQAHSVRDHIFFANEAYARRTPQRYRLLAHELANVVQEGPAVPIPRYPPLGKVRRSEGGDDKADPGLAPDGIHVAIGRPDDPVERDAERIAHDVVASPSAAPVDVGSSAVAVSTPDRLPAVLAGALGLQSRPLDDAERAQFEPRFGVDFSKVRIHNDAAAAASASALTARAYSVGYHIFFANGAYAQRTPHGNRLLAHELAHVVQGAPAMLIRRYPAVGKGRQWEGVGDTAEPGKMAEPGMVPGPSKALPMSFVGQIRASLLEGKKQAALTYLWVALISTGQVDQSLVLGSPKYTNDIPGHAKGDPPVALYDQAPLSDYKDGRPPPRPIYVSDRAFAYCVTKGTDTKNLNEAEGIPFLYSVVLHEYTHVLQFQNPTVAKTTSEGREIEAYCNEMLRSKATGLFASMDRMTEIWNNEIHERWITLKKNAANAANPYQGPAMREVCRLSAMEVPRLRPLYKRAYSLVYDAVMAGSGGAGGALKAIELKFDSSDDPPWVAPTGTGIRAPEAEHTPHLTPQPDDE